MMGKVMSKYEEVTKKLEDLSKSVKNPKEPVPKTVTIGTNTEVSEKRKDKESSKKEVERHDEEKRRDKRKKEEKKKEEERMKEKKIQSRRVKLCEQG